MTEKAATTKNYYLYGECPVKVICVDGFPDTVHAYDFKTKTFIEDESYLKLITDSLDTKRIAEKAFRNFCLSRGIKPI